MHSSLTAPQLWWRAAGRPFSAFAPRDATGCCAVCATDLAGRGVPVSQVAGATYSQAADFLRFGDHLCPACAWLHTETKQKHRGILAVGNCLSWPLFAPTADGSPTPDDRPLWRDALRAALLADGATALAGVMTTDPKPRLWPRCRAATVGAAALYVHAPDYGLSTMVDCDLATLDQLVTVIEPLLAAGWSKRAVASGLPRDHEVARRYGVRAALAMETQLRAWRQLPVFVPAVLVSVAVRRKERTDG